jgi:hypothetical protein
MAPETVPAWSFLAYAASDAKAAASPELRRRADALVRAQVLTKLGGGDLDAEAFLAERGRPSKAGRGEGQDEGAEAGGFVEAETVRVLAEVAASGAAFAGADLAASDPRHSAVAAPSADAPSGEWAAAAKHNRLLLERTEGGLLSAELQLEFAQSAWKVYAQMLEGLDAGARARLQGLEQETLAVNQERKAAHLAAAQREARAQAAWLEHTRHARTLRGALADEEQALDAKRGAASDGATQPDAKRHKIAS